MKITNNQFTLTTKFGPVGVKINGNRNFYLSNRLNKESGYGEEDLPPIVIRNRTYNYFSAQAGLTPNNLIDLTTYDFNGNDACFVSKYPENPYFKVKSIYSSEMTNNAKQALYGEIVEELNAFFNVPENKVEIEKIWAEIKQSNLIEKIQALKSEIFRLEEEINSKQKEIVELSVNVGS